MPMSESLGIVAFVPETIPLLAVITQPSLIPQQVLTESADCKAVQMCFMSRQHSCTWPDCVSCDSFGNLH